MVNQDLHHSQYFADICDVMKDEKCYDICNLSLSKYKVDRILKTTEMTKLKKMI